MTVPRSVMSREKRGQETCPSHDDGEWPVSSASATRETDTQDGQLKMGCRTQLLSRLEILLTHSVSPRGRTEPALPSGALGGGGVRRRSLIGTHASPTGRHVSHKLITSSGRDVSVGGGDKGARARRGPRDPLRLALPCAPPSRDIDHLDAVSGSFRAGTDVAVMA